MYLIIAEIFGMIVAAILLFSCIGQLLTARSDIAPLAGLALLLLTICGLIFVSTKIYHQIRSKFDEPQKVD